MATVIVSRQCYLVCEKINFITLQEADPIKAKEDTPWTTSLKKPTRTKKTKTKKPTKDEILYQIYICFEPAGSNRGEQSSVYLNVRGEEKCLSLFKEIVGQIREQNPDQLYLDKLVDKFLAGNSQ